MNFDLRFPVGMMFSVFGLILVGVGLTSTPEMIATSLGINMNLIWGAVMAVFGIIMLGLAIAGRSKGK